MTIYSLATSTYNGSEINVDLFATKAEAYGALARLIFASPNEVTRLKALLSLVAQDPSVGRETIDAFGAELDATEWIGVVQQQVYPDAPAAG